MQVHPSFSSYFVTTNVFREHECCVVVVFLSLFSVVAPFSSSSSSLLSRSSRFNNVAIYERENSLCCSSIGEFYLLTYLHIPSGRGVVRGSVFLFVNAREFDDYYYTVYIRRQTKS